MTRVAMLLFPRLTQLDLTAPFEVFARLPETKVDLISRTREPVAAERGLQIVPTAMCDNAPQCDLLFVPGGRGVDDAMLDDAILDFVRKQANGARFITSVCTGALLLGAAGLLRGYRATTHWSALEFLPSFGAEPVRERVVRDRNRITGAGVTAGIDLALRIAAELHGEATARAIQLALEYDPQPPFDSGSPDRAAPDAVDAIRAKNHGRREAVAKAAARMT